ncbi:MAG: hypothetical protein ABJO57_04275 [Lentilitoribacter sp.]
MNFLQIFASRELSFVDCKRVPNIDALNGSIETKSAHFTGYDVYSIISELIKELYVDRVLNLDQSFSTSQRLTSRQERFIKHLSIYLSHVVLGHSMRRIAQGFNIDRTSVSYACRKIEDKRDDDEHERFISSCERLIDILAGRLLS